MWQKEWSAKHTLKWLNAMHVHVLQRSSAQIASIYVQSWINSNKEMTELPQIECFSQHKIRNFNFCLHFPLEINPIHKASLWIGEYFVASPCWQCSVISHQRPSCHTAIVSISSKIKHFHLTLQARHVEYESHVLEHDRHEKAPDFTSTV